jgi:hypothetical protein
MPKASFLIIEIVTVPHRKNFAADIQLTLKEFSDFFHGIQLVAVNFDAAFQHSRISHSTANI